MLLDQYVDAFWRKDIDAIVALLKHEAVWEMPPFTGWYVGAENIGKLIDVQCPGGVHDMVMLPTTANGQPAFGALHARIATGATSSRSTSRCSTSTATGSGTSAAFFEKGLFEKFGLPARLPADTAGADLAGAAAPVTGRRPGHHHALELLERALGYTRGRCPSVGTDRSGPTPCAGWSLADLLAHMDDGLDAFLEAAGGAVRVEVPRRPGADVEVLQTKACHLLGVWSAPTRRVRRRRRPSVPAALLVAAAALEITVHGWDVGAGDRRRRRDLPEDLARALLPVAHGGGAAGGPAGAVRGPGRTGPDASRRPPCCSASSADHR